MKDKQVIKSFSVLSFDGNVVTGEDTSVSTLTESHGEVGSSQEGYVRPDVSATENEPRKERPQCVE